MNQSFSELLHKISKLNDERNNHIVTSLNYEDTIYTVLLKCFPKSIEKFYGLLQLYKKKEKQNNMNNINIKLIPRS